MAESSRATHIIVEIKEEEEEKSSKMLMESHPLREISQNAGHQLLFKLYQRHQRLLAHNVSFSETRLLSLKSNLFHLSASFFLFHALSLILLSARAPTPSDAMWVPPVVSLATSAVLVVLVQVRLGKYWEVEGVLGRERGEGRALSRCVLELRMKGATFDLDKDGMMMMMKSNNKIRRSSCVDSSSCSTWRRVGIWCRNYFLTLCLICFTGLFVAATSFVLWVSLQS